MIMRGVVVGKTGLGDEGSDRNGQHKSAQREENAARLGLGTTIYSSSTIVILPMRTRVSKSSTVKAPSEAPKRSM